MRQAVRAAAAERRWQQVIGWGSRWLLPLLEAQFNRMKSIKLRFGDRQAEFLGSGSKRLRLGKRIVPEHGIRCDADEPLSGARVRDRAVDDGDVRIEVHLRVVVPRVKAVQPMTVHELHLVAGDAV